MPSTVFGRSRNARIHLLPQGEGRCHTRHPGQTAQNRGRFRTTPPAIPIPYRKTPPVLSPPSEPVPYFLRSRCRMDRERFDASGRECPWPGAQTSVRPNGGGDGLRGSAGGALSQRRPGKPATGPGSATSLRKRARRGTPLRACGGHGASFARQGPCRNLRPKQFSRSVRTAAGATRAESPEEGQVSKPAPCLARLAPVGCGHHPASSGPRASSATPVYVSHMHNTTISEALPARSPPDRFLLTPRRTFSRGTACGWFGQVTPLCPSPPPSPRT